MSPDYTNPRYFMEWLEERHAAEAVRNVFKSVFDAGEARAQLTNDRYDWAIYIQRMHGADHGVHRVHVELKHYRTDEARAIIFYLEEDDDDAIVTFFISATTMFDLQFRSLASALIS
jgi:hypothetical protein